MGNEPIGDRSIALFLLGLLAFSPILLSVFRSDALLSGFPLLYLYLFGAWVVLIALMVLVFRTRDRGEDGESPRPPTGE
jgi:hypothetical protein